MRKINRESQQRRQRRREWGICPGLRFKAWGSLCLAVTTLNLERILFKKPKWSNTVRETDCHDSQWKISQNNVATLQEGDLNLHSRLTDGWGPRWNFWLLGLVLGIKKAGVLFYFFFCFVQEARDWSTWNVFEWKTLTFLGLGKFQSPLTDRDLKNNEFIIILQ